MPAIPAQELIDEGRCYECYGQLTLAQIISLALLRRQLLALNPAADVSPQGLISYSTCYACYTGDMFDLMELALLDQISQLS